MFCMEVDIDLGYVGYVGQGRRERSNAENRVFLHGFYLALRSKVRVNVNGQVHGLRQKVKVWCRVEGSILGARLCQVQQRAIRVITSLRSINRLLITYHMGKKGTKKGTKMVPLGYCSYKWYHFFKRAFFFS